MHVKRRSEDNIVHGEDKRHAEDYCFDSNEKAASWLARENYKSLFLDLPRDLEKFLRDYIDGEASIEDLWRSYGYLS